MNNFLELHNWFQIFYSFIINLMIWLPIHSSSSTLYSLKKYIFTVLILIMLPTWIWDIQYNIIFVCPYVHASICVYVCRHDGFSLITYVNRRTIPIYKLTAWVLTSKEYMKTKWPASGHFVHIISKNMKLCKTWVENTMKLFF